MKQLRSLAVLLGALSVLLGSSSLHAGIVFTNIFSFNGTNGAFPCALVRAGNNKFYGVTEEGGPDYTGPENEDVGGVFSITSDGVFSNLFFFEGTNGTTGDYLTPGMDGNFYGLTSDTVFKLNPDGTMANPHLAALSGFSAITSGLVQDHDGTLYGTTYSGGTSGYGTIYKIDTNGVFSTIAEFNGTNGAMPVSLLLGADNNFYGITSAGGNGFVGGPVITGNGTIFRVDRSGNLTNIFFLDSGPSCLVQGSDGDLYGSAISGGTNSAGSIFRVTTNGVLVWSFSFNGTNGYLPAWLTAANDGNFYGVTFHGGPSYVEYGPGNGYGTIFRITPGGSFTCLVQFDGTNDNVPVTIIQGTDGNLYGATAGDMGLGAIFKLTLPPCPATNRLMLTTVANFEDTNSDDYPALMQGNDGMLYGVTQDGGAYNLGTVFRSTLSGSITTLVSFDGTNGGAPSTPPVQAADGSFYGTTGYGATIYRMDSNGVLTTLFTFNETNGQGPGGINGLIVGNDGALYGVAQAGGPNFTNINNGDGTVFKITTNGAFTLLASFDGTNGFSPASIIQASDGNFYGTTVGGGIDDSNGLGTVFQMTPGGQINTLVRFNGTNGLYPLRIMQASDGCLYGTTRLGGAFYTEMQYGYEGYGTVFKVTTNGDFTLLASFDATNGAEPLSRLIEVCPGILYGTASYGGLYPNGPGDDNGPYYAFNSGTLYLVTTTGNLRALLSFAGPDSFLPSVPWISFIKASDGNFYGTTRDGFNYTGYYGYPFFWPGAIFCIRPVQAPMLQSFAQAGQLNLNWNAWAGYPYTVMYETNLTGSNWNLLSTVTPQTNGITSCSDLIGPDTQRFYRVVLQLP